MSDVKKQFREDIDHVRSELEMAKAVNNEELAGGLAENLHSLGMKSMALDE